MAKVSAAIAPVIAVDRKASKPLHKQIYEGFLSVIVGGNMRAGQRVPSSRTLSIELGISRIPVLNAYAQFWLRDISRAAKEQGRSYPSLCRRASPSASRKPCNPKRRVQVRIRWPSRFALNQIDRAPWVGGWGSFMVHQPAFDHFPFPIWSSLITRHSKSPRFSAIHNTDPRGSESCREAICTYLRTARAVRCDPGQVMVVAGSQQALEISARVLLGNGSPVWIEEPGTVWRAASSRARAAVWFPFL